MLLFLIVLIISIALHSPAFARAIIDESEQFNLIDHVTWVYYDTQSLEEIKKIPEELWLPSPDTALSLGLIDKSLWVKFEVDVTSKAVTDTYIIDVGNSTITSLEIIQQTPNSLILKQGPIGMATPFKDDRYISSAKNHFSIDLSEQGVHSFWLKIHQNGYFDLPLQLTAPKRAFNIQISQIFSSSMFYGFFLALTIYHLFYFSIIRDRIYLSYVFFTTGTALQFGYMDGILFQYIWPNSPALNSLSGALAIPLISLSFIMLCLDFLNIKDESRFLKFFSNTVLYINIAALILSIFISLHLALLISLSILIITFICVTIISFTHFFIHKEPISLIFLLSISFFMALCIVITSSIIGLIPFDINHLWDTLKLAMGCQMLIFASAIAFKIRFINKERKQALNESKAKSEIIAKVSHELRTPLNGILGLSHLMTPLLDGQTKTYNHMIHQSATALLTVINDLLDVSRINAGKFSINLHPTNLHDLINSISSSLFTQLNGTGILGNTIIGNKVPKFALTDSDRLRQLIGNILGNAIKFTQSGSITLEIDSVEGTADIYQVKVTDTGAGISEENIKKIFQPYEQAEKNNNSSQTSTGLGLFITQQLAKAMDTQINVESTLNKGSIFWFELQLTPCDEIEIESDNEAQPQKSLDILVAEDNKINQLIISKLLSNLGHKAIIKNNGQEAFDELKLKKYDLVLMDCDMPVLDGYSAVKMWREYEQENNLPPLKITALTAHAYQGHEQKVLDCGMDSQILKPIKPKELELFLKSGK